MTIDVIPGSFNPLHDGHRSIYESINSEKVYFLLSKVRYNKPAYTEEELQKIISQFDNYNFLISSGVKLAEHILYLNSGLNCKINMHVGFDTAKRYLEDPDVERDAEAFRLCQSYLYVYPRGINGCVLNYSDLSIPDRHKEYIKEGSLVTQKFLGLSSTAIREKQIGRGVCT